MSSLCLRIRADPQLAGLGLVDYCVRDAWCVMSACVLQVCTYVVVLGVRVLCRRGIIIRGEIRRQSLRVLLGLCISPDGPESADTPASAYCNPFVTSNRESPPLMSRPVSASKSEILTGRVGNCGLAVHYSRSSSHVRRTQDGQ